MVQMDGSKRNLNIQFISLEKRSNETKKKKKRLESGYINAFIYFGCHWKLDEI